MKKIFALVLASLLVLGCFAGCTQDNSSDMSYVKNKNKLVVGITEYKPMDYKDANGEWIGFDADFARLFAAELGVEVEFFVLADWDKKFIELDTKNIDCVWNGMTITDEATSNSSVSNPYVVNAQVVVMKADKLASYTTVDSMKDLTFAVENGSAGQSVATKSNLKTVAVKDQAAALMEVAAGTSDACVIDITMAKAMTGAGTDYADLGMGISLSSEEYGVSFRKGSDLTAKFNEFMNKLKANGELQKLATKYSVTLVD